MNAEHEDADVDPSFEEFLLLREALPGAPGPWQPNPPESFWWGEPDDQP